MASPFREDDVVVEFLKGSGPGGQRRNKRETGVRLIHLPTVRSKHLDASLHSLVCSFHSVFSGADIVHYHGIGPAFFSWIPRIFGKRVVCTVHRKDWQAAKWKPAARAFLRLCERASILFPHRTIVRLQGAPG